MTLLEADLDMKREVGRLIHPQTSLGDKFWHTFYSRFAEDEAKCFSFRQWIVPGNVTVPETPRPSNRILWDDFPNAVIRL